MCIRDSQQRPTPAPLAGLETRQQQRPQRRPAAVVVPEGIPPLPGGGVWAVPVRMDQGAARTAVLSQGYEPAPAAGAEPCLRTSAHRAEATPAQEEGTTRPGKSAMEDRRKHGKS